MREPVVVEGEGAIAADDVEVIPAEPPFLGDLNRGVASPSAAAVLESEPSTADLPVLDVDEAAALPAVVAVPERVPAVETPEQEIAETVAPAPDELFASGDTGEATEIDAVVEADTEAFSDEAVEVTPGNVSRWPDPIPFGQPLP